MRLTKIICTLGPSCWLPDQVEALARAGMNVARINLSHGNWAQHRKTIRMVKALNAKFARESKHPSCVGILLDTKGAEVRTGDVRTHLKIARGELVVFSPHLIPGESKQVIIVDHRGFSKDAQEAERILLDNGKISFELVSVRKDGSVVARAREAGTVGSRRHVNLPGANLDMPSITDDDWESIKHAADENVDWIGLSFIRSPDEIREVRKYLAKRKRDIGLIAKIETRQAVTHMDAIIEEADAIMVARGDLGAEIPFEQMPVVQDELVCRSRRHGKPVIVATHMLESMVENPIPTRAEVTDIAHAATIGTDCTMLSGETASGAHPLLALDAMDRVLRETEKHLAETSGMLREEVRSERDARAEAAVGLAMSMNAAAIVVITKSGQTAREICRFRPKMPVIAFTESDDVQRRVQLSFGVLPFVTKLKSDPEKAVEAALQIAKKAGLLKKGQKVVLVSDTLARNEAVSAIQVRDAR